jgi:hypothetical protein
LLGAVEEGEQCDDSSECCENCKLKHCAECSYSSSNECCDKNCKILPSSTRCDNGAGFCANGQVNKTNTQKN